MFRYPESGYGHGEVYEIDSHGNRTRVRRLHRSMEYQRPEESLRKSAQGYRVAANCILYRATALRQANYFRVNAGWKSAEDWDLSVRLAVLGWGNVYASTPVANYRVWNDAALSRLKRRVPEIEFITKVYKETLEPEYVRRGWDTAVLRKNMRNRAVLYADALGSPLLSTEERESYKASLRKLDNSFSMAMAMSLNEAGFGPLIRLVRNAKIRFKDCVKNVLWRVTKLCCGNRKMATRSDGGSPGARR